MRSTCEEIGERLRVRSHGVFADGGVELPVAPEVNGAAIVIRGGEIVEVEQDHLAARGGHVARGGEAADAVVDRRRRSRVIEVDELVDEEVGIERHAEETALNIRIHGEDDERRGQESVVLDDAQRTALLADEDPPSGAMAIAVDAQTADRRFAEAGRQRRRSD